MSWQDVGEMPCSVARSLSILGDRWTLLIIRSAFMRMRRFADFQAQLAIPKHVLSVRLNRLVDDGVLQKVQYQEAPPRHEYKLTDKGKDLYPVIIMLTAWGDKWLDGGSGAPLLYRHKACGEIFTPVPACSACGEFVSAQDVMIEAGPGLAAHVAKQTAKRASPAKTGTKSVSKVATNAAPKTTPDAAPGDGNRSKGSQRKKSSALHESTPKSTVAHPSATKRKRA